MELALEHRHRPVQCRQVQAGHAIVPVVNGRCNAVPVMEHAKIRGQFVRKFAFREITARAKRAMCALIMRAFRCRIVHIMGARVRIFKL